jgi:hypothetical protein
MMKLPRCLLVIAGLLMGSPATGDQGEVWRATFDSNWLGPMEGHFEILRDENSLYAVSRSGAAALIAALPGDHRVDAGLVVFTAAGKEDGTYEGTFLAPWNEGRLTFTIEGDTLHGSVDGGAFAGTLAGKRVETVEPIRDYVTVVRQFDRVVEDRIFDPHDLQAPAYKTFREALGQIAAAARDDFDLLFGFHFAWQQEPFSHFQLKRSKQTAEEMFAYFDDYRVGFDAATIHFDGGTAVLKVRTMMGADTIEQIEDAYRRIADAGAETLVIDLRGNGGGAFAVKPLVEHVIDEPLEAGFFVSQAWTRRSDRAPTKEEALSSPAWSGWSIISFWKDVQEQDLLRIRFTPAEPNFDGRVFVLVDEHAASATEMAADALRASGTATLIGQRTAGEMLSQSMFDVGEGFVVSLPVADYYSMQHGRLEGAGVPVDIEADPADALELALGFSEDAETSGASQ